MSELFAEQQVAETANLAKIYDKATVGDRSVFNLH